MGADGSSSNNNMMITPQIEPCYYFGIDHPVRREYIKGVVIVDYLLLLLLLY